MHSHSSKRKPRYQSEPPPSRPSLDSPSGSDDEMDVDNDNHNPPGRGGTSDSKERVLNVQQANKGASIAEKARAALDSSLRTVTNSGGKSRPIAFPLTPTSAAGESTDRTMASLTAAAAAAAASASAASEGALDNKKRKKDDERSNNAPEDKMSQPTTINDPSARPPPPEAPVNKNKNKNSTSIHLNSLRTSSSHSNPYTHANGSSASPVSAAPRTMSYRVENQSIRPRHFQEQNIHDSHYYGHPSPPPIATLTHSPSLSSDRSSVSSPAPTILPPLNHPNQFQPQPYITTSAHRYSASAQPGAYHHPHYYPSTVSPPEVFSTPAQSYAHAYSTGGGGYAPPPPPHIPFHHSADMSQYSVNPYATTSSLYGHAGHGGGGSGGFTPIYTDDASTKLSDRVRRRCFNCCTTDTSTWRRSSLNPGKVLCNKCGLFERTHSRPRPDQFPHKRAPLQIPTQNVAHDAVNAAQPMSRSPHSQAANTGQSLPPTTGHPSLGPTYSHPTPLPQIHEWNRANSNAALGAGPNHAGTSSSTTSSSAGPSSRAHSSSSAAENRHHPYASSVPTSGTGAGTNSSSGAGETRSPQPVPSRLVKRSDSLNSDLVNTPPPQHRSSQNITPSPSPPPEVPQAGVTTPGQESSPRVVAPQSVTTGTSSEAGNQ